MGDGEVLRYWNEYIERPAEAARDFEKKPLQAGRSSQSLVHVGYHREQTAHIKARTGR